MYIIVNSQYYVASVPVSLKDIVCDHSSVPCRDPKLSSRSSRKQTERLNSSTTMTSHSSATKTRRECRPLLRQALNTATLRHHHSLQQANDKDPGLLDQGKHSVAEQASPSIPAAPSGQMPGHGLDIREHERDDGIGFGMLGGLSDATVTTPSDPTFGAVGSGRGLVDSQKGRIAAASGIQNACLGEHVGSDIELGTTRRGISEGTRTEEVRLAVRLVEDSARQLAELKQRRLERNMALG